MNNSSIICLLSTTLIGFIKMVQNKKMQDYCKRNKGFKKIVHNRIYPHDNELK